MTCSLHPQPTEFLITADAIGRRIAQEAFWHGERCNWVGAEPTEIASAGFRPALTYKALPPDLYAGTSGIALFLAELYVATGDHATRQTALGAIRQALARTGAVPPYTRLGMFTGWPGIALAAARVGMLLAEGELLEQAAPLALSALAEDQNTPEFDVIAGRAGAIAALLVLHSILGDAALLNRSVRLGNELLAMADQNSFGYSWSSPGLRTQHNLTGFSHGASGVGYALLELFEVTGHTDYRDAAMKAFQYERHWFVAKEGNWPDFRERRSTAGRRKSAPSCAAFWCHGAPGIALARLRAFELLHDETCKVEAQIALATTHRALEVSLSKGTENFSLCHGLAGNAEALLYGNQVACVDDSGMVQLAGRVADEGIARYSTGRAAWPCGTHSEETPNLMLGLAGIGHFYLRMYDATTPSILLPSGAEFSSKRKLMNC